jgi:N-acetylneuraminic acid mutarotase
MVTLGDALYVVGGVGAEPGSIFVYDRGLDAWRRLLTALPTPREHLTAVVLAGRLHVIGGRWSGQGNLATLEIYEPAANQWTRGADMPTARGGLTAAVIGGRIHVTGGEDLASGETFGAHEIFDRATGAWTTAPPLPTSRHGLASGEIGGRWYVVGGGEQAGAMTFVSLSALLEVFTP